MTAIAASVRRGGSLAATGMSAAGLLVLVALAVSMLLGYRLLVVRSDSMAPAIRTGDIIVTRVQRAGSIGPNDIVTFVDPTREGRLVTHRVIERRDDGGLVSFVTRGDANGGEERWSVPARGRLGEYRMRLPRLGFIVSPLGTRWLRLGALLTFSVLAGLLAIRRIWAL